jgi:hypothetical protein
MILAKRGVKEGDATTPPAPGNIREAVPSRSVTGFASRIDLHAKVDPLCAG